MKNRNRFLIFFVAVVMIITALPLNAAAEAKTADDIILFGSYPQSEVRDSALLSALNDINLNWESYDYYCGTGKWNDGQMHPSDYMRYADVSYGGDKYRAVTFDSFRPYFSGLMITPQRSGSRLWRTPCLNKVKKYGQVHCEPARLFCVYLIDNTSPQKSYFISEFWRLPLKRFRSYAPSDNCPDSRWRRTSGELSCSACRADR